MRLTKKRALENIRGKVDNLDFLDDVFDACDELLMSGVFLKVILPVVLILKLGDESMRQAVLSV